MEEDEVFVAPFYVMFGDMDDTWSGGTFDTFKQALIAAEDALDDGVATGYQIFDDNDDLVEEYYLEDEEEEDEEI